ncbi:uncharacterized protein wu:fb74b10 [Brienomyrus brachyistius]|uniref:uncharacterized protein wu:fb74b10 n=1 Tax=Brienomyrus brachyistius TaxID=42636 RepID=UPI0020B22AE4|nr:uncharacterized protein wu:fb74b10 [Brienomyrus brachyistius]
MAAAKARRSGWTQEMEESLVELWQEHQCLFVVSDDLYHNRAEKEKRWTEIANSLQRPVEDVKTRAVSLRTQYSRMIKPKPSGSRNKPLTLRQKWLLGVMDFIKQYIVHRPCDSALDVSFSDQDDMEHHDNLTDLLGQPAVKSPQSRPGTPSAAAASAPEWLNDEASPALANEAPSPVPSAASREAREESGARGVKRKRRSESGIEQQRLFVLKQMAAKFDADPVPDALTTFGNHVACEIRQLQDPANLTKLKRDIINMIYDAQDAERSSLSSSSAQFDYRIQKNEKE